MHPCLHLIHPWLFLYDTIPLIAIMMLYQQPRFESHFPTVIDNYERIDLQHRRNTIFRREKTGPHRRYSAVQALK